MLACKSDQKEQTKESDIYAPYGLLTEELQIHNSSLRRQIQQKLENISQSESNSIMAFDSLTVEFENFLDQTIAELIDQIGPNSPMNYSGDLARTDIINSYFFDDSGYNSKGREFVAKIDRYREQILSLVSNEELVQRINVALATRDVQNRNGEIIKYLDYHYKDIPLIASIMFLSNKKRSVLELELNFICETN